MQNVIRSQRCVLIFVFLYLIMWNAFLKCYFVYRVLLSLCMRVDAYFRFGCDRDSGDRSQCAGKMGQEGRGGY